MSMSDRPEIAMHLERAFNYINSFYHCEPKLDILELPAKWIRYFDVVISSDVLEHVNPPVCRAFEGLFHLIKPGGALLLSVPWVPEGYTTEHYPDLHEYTILHDDSGAAVLHNKTRDGRIQVFHNLVFHGGPGHTLEMRVFSKRGLIDALSAAGFCDIFILDAEYLPFGIVWNDPWSVPVMAKRPAA